MRMYLNSLHVHYMQCCLGSTDMRKKLNFLVHSVVQYTLNLDHIRDSPFLILQTLICTLSVNLTYANQDHRPCNLNLLLRCTN